MKDAHDRFANLQVSYLLARMEAFKGLAILATNRKKDLDEAFMRRLCYVVEFPQSGADERERIWRQVFPERVATDTIDFAFLAVKFPLAGGHIRSIAFNACLQAAASKNGEGAGNGGYVGRVDMSNVLMAVKRELAKLERSVNAELFGNYASLVQEVSA